MLKYCEACTRVLLENPLNLHPRSLIERYFQIISTLNQRKTSLILKLGDILKFT